MRVQRLAWHVMNSIRSPKSLERHKAPPTHPSKHGLMESEQEAVGQECDERRLVKWHKREATHEGRGTFGGGHTHTGGIASIECRSLIFTAALLCAISPAGSAGSVAACGSSSLRSVRLSAPFASPTHPLTSFTC